MQQTHPHEVALALIGLFQEGESVADFQEGGFHEGGPDPFVDLINNELEFLELGNNYVDDIDGMVDVTDGIADASDGEALSPIRNLGERLVVLVLFDDFEGNINWEDYDKNDEDDANGTVAQTDSSRHQFLDAAWRRKKKNTEGNCHDLLSLPCLVLLVNRGGCCGVCVCLCVSLCQVSRGDAPARFSEFARNK